MEKIDFDDLRNEFDFGKLLENDVPDDPVVLFEEWMRDAISAVSENANSMILSTVSKEGKPSSRIVLLKDFNENAFVFFSNYNSRKGNELSDNPNASLLFHWNELHRQIRIEGKVQRTEIDVSDDYFNSRPENSRISAMISPQSEVIPDREFLEKQFHMDKLSNKIERPSHWGGYILKPDYFEFWQGRVGRLHDRIAYEVKSGEWERYRLAP